VGRAVTADDCHPTPRLAAYLAQRVPAPTPRPEKRMTTDLHEFVEFARQARCHMLERGGSFGHLEEPDAVFEPLRNFWTQLKS
jgi:hypothetical protein